MATNRRRFLQTVFSGGGALLIAPSAFGAATEFIAKGGNTPLLLAEQTLLRTPSVFGGEPIVCAKGEYPIWSDTSSAVFTANGYIAPTIKARKGDVVTVPFRNNLNEPLAIHWHGFELPADMDGHPKDAFQSNTSKTYQFKVKQRAGTYFYHSHAHERTAEHVYGGMYGLFIVSDDEEQALNLPKGNRDIAVAFQDVRSNAQRELVYTPVLADNVNGWTGNIILANGTPNGYVNVDTAWHRVRLVNASNARTYKVALSTNKPMYIIASDGGLLEKPVPVTSFMMSPAERYEVLINFADYNVGDTVRLVSLEYKPPGPHMGLVSQHPQGIALDMLTFKVESATTDSFTLPSTLSVIERYKESDALRTRTFALGMLHQMGQMKHTINDKLFDMMHSEETVYLDELEIWEIKNEEADMFHPFHIHNAQFQILSRNGSTDIPEYEKGWKDTVLINASETVRILIKFTEYEGMYLLHCHNLEHEDDGMMINFDIMMRSSSVDNSSHNTVLSCYPQPANTHATIKLLPRNAETTMQIFTSNGKQVATHSISAGSSSFQFSVEELSNGSYWCAIGNQQARLIVAR